MSNGRLSGWAVGALGVLLTAQPLNRLTAQHVIVGPQIAFGDYREVSSDLHYRGAGGGLKATLERNKLSADVVLSKVQYQPTRTGTATTEVDASAIEVR